MRRRAGWCVVAAVAVLASCAGRDMNDPAAVANVLDEETGPGGFGVQSSTDLFWRYWSDGKGEMNGYDLIQPRYGELRQGRAVLVFVTEPYSRSRHVKVDRYEPQNPDHATALKLNHVRKFQTGIYDYSVMTSVFTDPTRAFRPMEITFSMQEWCGHVFEEAHFDADGLGLTFNSYFEGETGAHRLDGDVIAEDALFIALRGLAAEELAAPTGTVELLPSATQRRFRHVEPSLSRSTITWAEGTSSVTVPAGTYEVREASWGRQDGQTCTARIEVPYPHRLIGWSCTDGEQATLTGTTRLAYWETHREGDERLLEGMGLHPSRYRPQDQAP